MYYDETGVCHIYRLNICVADVVGKKIMKVFKILQFINNNSSTVCPVGVSTHSLATYFGLYLSQRTIVVFLKECHIYRMQCITSPAHYEIRIVPMARVPVLNLPVLMLCSSSLTCYDLYILFLK